MISAPEPPSSTAATRPFDTEIVRFAKAGPAAFGNTHAAGIRVSANGAPRALRSYILPLSFRTRASFGGKNERS